MNFFSHLECGYCTKTYEADKLWNLCPECNKPTHPNEIKVCGGLCSVCSFIKIVKERKVATLPPITPKIRKIKTKNFVLKDLSRNMPKPKPQNMDMTIIRPNSPT